MKNKGFFTSSHKALQHLGARMHSSMGIWRCQNTVHLSTDPAFELKVQRKSQKDVHLGARMHSSKGDGAAGAATAHHHHAAALQRAGPAVAAAPPRCTARACPTATLYGSW